MQVPLAAPTTIAQPLGRAAGNAADALTSQGVADDFESLAVLYDRHATPVFSLAMRILREARAAEDVVQEVFLQAWVERRRYDQASGPVGAWLLVLTRSRAVDRIRASRHHGGQPCGPCAVATVAAADTGGAGESSMLRDALLLLPAEQRHSLELAFYEGYTYDEIAVILQQPVGTVKTGMRCAMVSLKTALEKCRPGPASA